MSAIETSIETGKTGGKATRIRLFSFNTPQMRAFHFAWLGFFVCFIAWFGVAPLMVVIRKELHLTPDQIANIVIASVASTIIARLAIGWACDRYGPRLTHTVLLVLGAIPVIGIGLAHDYTTFLLFRLAIGAIGASFVVTQYHTSAMFAPNCVGTANAATAGWGNMGGGVAQLVMPLIFSAFLALGLTSAASWRVAMIVPGIAMLVVAAGYFFLTQDNPAGNFAELRGLTIDKKPGSGMFLAAAKDPRVWALAVIYGACFGIEITVHNVASLYFTDRFGLGLTAAGAVVGAFGMLALFARALGGFISDKISRRFSLSGRVLFLGISIFCQGILLTAFSLSGHVTMAIGVLIIFGLFVHISCGATYAVIPFVNKKAIGSVAGIVGAGGNAGAVLSGLLLKSAASQQRAFLLMGICTIVTALAACFVKFTAGDEQEMPAAIPQSLPEGVASCA